MVDDWVILACIVCFFVGIAISSVMQYYFIWIQGRIRKQVEYDKNQQIKLLNAQLEEVKKPNV